MSLPARCDVAVLGAGLAGLLCADRLAASGARVLLLSGTATPASERTLGIAALGWSDSPARLSWGLGETQARALHLWSALALSSLFSTCEELAVPHVRTGSDRVALDERERSEWNDSRELLERWGLGGELREVEPSASDLGGLHLADDGVVDVAALCSALRTRFLARGGVIASGPGTLREEAGAPVLRVGEHDVLCELAVAAAGAEAASAHPYFNKTLFPVRISGQRVRRAELGTGVPRLARHRFEAWVQQGEQLAFFGSRWAVQPEMEAGQTDAETVHPRVAAAQDAFLAQRLGVPLDAARSRWSGICGWSCDGLPLLGPLPGAPKVIGLLGWSGWGLSLMARAVDEVSAAILGEPAPDGVGTPMLLTARRLV